MEDFNKTKFSFKYWLLQMKVSTNSKFIEISIGILLLSISASVILHEINNLLKTFVH